MSRVSIYVKDSKQLSEEERLEYLSSLPTRVEMFKCDNCGNLNQYDTITVEYGFGSSRDMEVEHFCSDECLEEEMLKRVNRRITSEWLGNSEKIKGAILPTSEPEDFEPSYIELDED